MWARALFPHILYVMLRNAFASAAAGAVFAEQPMLEGVYRVVWFARIQSNYMHALIHTGVTYRRLCYHQKSSM